MDGKDARRTIVLLLYILYRYCVFIICACLDGEGRSSGLVRGREKKKIDNNTKRYIRPNRATKNLYAGSVRFGVL